jgi:hypothetical protein
MLIAGCATPIKSPLIRPSLVSSEEVGSRNQRREAGIRCVGIFIFLFALNFLLNDESNSIKHSSADNKLCRQSAPVGNSIH